MAGAELGRFILTLWEGSSPKGWFGTEQAPQASGHGLKAARVQAGFGPCSWAQGGIFVQGKELMVLVAPSQLSILCDSVFKYTGF